MITWEEKFIKGRNITDYTGNYQEGTSDRPGAYRVTPKHDTAATGRDFYTPEYAENEDTDAGPEVVGDPGTTEPRREFDQLWVPQSKADEYAKKVCDFHYENGEWPDNDWLP